MFVFNFLLFLKQMLCLSGIIRPVDAVLPQSLMILLSLNTDTKLNVEEELERRGDRFTCSLTNVSQGKAGISLMSSRLVSGGLSTVARHHRHQLRPQFRRKHPPTTFVSSQKDIIPLQVVTSNEYLLVY